MKIKSISLKTDLDRIFDKEMTWSDVFVTLDDDRIYIVFSNNIQ